MSKAKVSWLLCIGRLVSKTDNVMHFACLVKQACVDLVSDPFGLWAVCYGAQSPDATWRFYQPLWWCDSLGQSGKSAELLLMAEWPNGEIAWEQNCLRPSCSWGSPHFGLHSGSWVHPYWAPCNLWLRFALHTSFRQKCLKLRCHDFSALADWSPKQRYSVCTLHAW